jgi:hypothetical protein
MNEQISEERQLVQTEMHRRFEVLEEQIQRLGAGMEAMFKRFDHEFERVERRLDNLASKPGLPAPTQRILDAEEKFRRLQQSLEGPQDVLNRGPQYSRPDFPENHGVWQIPPHVDLPSDNQIEER